MAVLTVGVTAVDYLMPAAGAKKFGASRYGFWGAFVGIMILKLIASGIMTFYFVKGLF